MKNIFYTFLRNNAGIWPSSSLERSSLLFTAATVDTKKCFKFNNTKFTNTRTDKMGEELGKHGRNKFQNLQKYAF